MSHFIQYAKIGTAQCKGPKPCAAQKTKIGKGQLRFGSAGETQFGTSTYWRHWGCVTAKVIQNTGVAFNLIGIEDLSAEDRQKVEEAFKVGHIANEDATPACRTAVLPQSLWNEEELKELEDAKLAAIEKKKETQAKKKRERDGAHEENDTKSEPATQSQENGDKETASPPKPKKAKREPKPKAEKPAKGESAEVKASKKPTKAKQPKKKATKTAREEEEMDESELSEEEEEKEVMPKKKR